MMKLREKWKIGDYCVLEGDIEKLRVMYHYFDIYEKKERMILTGNKGTVLDLSDDRNLRRIKEENDNIHRY